jgi:peptidoglycan L-alanyl-D-glutamate endopeptidase CwlK
MDLNYFEKNRIKNEKKLLTCHPDLQKVFNELQKDTLICVICGFRGEKEQDEAFKSRHSKLRWPESKHNDQPSRAVDVAPLGKDLMIDWDNINNFKMLSLKVFSTAYRLGITNLEWGGSWINFPDFPHYELQ